MDGVDGDGENYADGDGWVKLIVTNVVELA